MFFFLGGGGGGMREFNIIIFLLNVPVINKRILQTTPKYRDKVHYHR